MPDPKIDNPLEAFVKKGRAAQKAVDRELERQRRLDAIETYDAELMLRELALLARQHSPKLNAKREAVALARRFLKKHWSDGWRAAGGPSGAPGDAA